MKRNIFKLTGFAMILSFANMACKKTSTTLPNNGDRLVKKVTKDANNNLVSYSRLVYNNMGKLDSANTYSDTDNLDEYIAFKYNNVGTLDNITYENIAEISAAQVSFTYTNGILTKAHKTGDGSVTADYTLTYEGSKLKEVKTTNNTGGGPTTMTNTITYNTEGKANKQTSSFFTGGGPLGASFNISNKSESVIEYLSYYPQTIKSLAPPLDNLIVKYYPQQMKIETSTFYYETTFNELGNPIKTNKRLNDVNGTIEEVTTYEYQ